jgi:membrane-associated protein
MLPGFDLSSFASTAGPWAAILVVALIVFAESGLFVGFFLPGDSVLFTVGVLIQSGHLPFNINAAVAIFFIAAALGDSTGYLFGKVVGYRLFKRPNSFLFRHENIEKAQAFYEKYGGKTIILGRFIPVVRTFVPIVAGIGEMKYKVFISFNIIGGLLWAAGVTYIGYFLGSLLTKAGIKVDSVLLPIIILIVLISIAPAAYHVLKEKEQRTAIRQALRTSLLKLRFKK